MKIKNVSNSSIILSDLSGPQGGSGLTLQAQAEATIFDEDAEKSSQLSTMMTAGAIIKLTDEEPGDSGPSADSDGLIKQWILLNDVYAQFAAGNDGINGVFTPNTYIGPMAGTQVEVHVTDGDGTRDLLNSVSTVVMEIVGGSASAPKINGVNGPVTLTMAQGKATAMISASGAGTVDITMTATTHPSVTLTVDSAIVTLN